MKSFARYCRKLKFGFSTTIFNRAKFEKMERKKSDSFDLKNPQLKYFYLFFEFEMFLIVSNEKNSLQNFHILYCLIPSTNLVTNSISVYFHGPCRLV